LRSRSQQGYKGESIARLTYCPPLQFAALCGVVLQTSD
jgi:hypothetical protein